MRSGVSFPSYADLATYAVVSGSANSDYPIQNLADLQSPRTVAKAAATGAFSFTLILPAAQLIQFLALIHHNASAAETIRIRLFSDNNPDPTGNAGAIVHDSTAVAIFPSGAAASTTYPQIRPYVLDAAVSARSARIDLSSNAAAWSIGAVEVGGWWEWTDVAVPRQFGVSNRDSVFEQALDYDEVTSRWAPRMVRGSRGLVDQSENDTTGMDFMREKMLSRPFVWVWDYADPTTWIRENILVRNASTPLLTAIDYPAGRYSFDLIEHLR